jgi:hypothetical protein
MMGALLAVLAIVAVGGRAIDGLRRAEAESILSRLPEAEARAYYDVLRRRMRRIVLMRALALVSLLWIFFVFRQRLIQHEAPRPTVAVGSVEGPPR